MTGAVATAPRSAGIGVPAQVGYGVGQIAGQVFRDTPSLLLLFFMTTTLGIAPAIAGVAVFVPKLVMGILCDMSVGLLSDRWQRRFARRWWLLAGAVLAPVAMIALFHVPVGSHAFQVAYVIVAFSFYMAVYAIFSVPYLAISGELTADPQARTVLMAWRLVFTSAGVLVASALAPALVQRGGGGQPGYETMSLVLAAICPAALLIAFLTIARLEPAAPTNALRGLRLGDIGRALARPRFAVLCLVSTLQLAGAGMSYASLLYFLAYNMKRADALAVIGGIVLAACAGIVLAQPLWVALAGRIGKRWGYIVGSTIFALTYLFWAFCAGFGVWVAFVLSFIAAVGNSGWAMLGFSMIADVVAEDEAHGGIYSAAWVASDKIGFALGGTLLVGLILSGFGFDSLRAVHGLPQSDSALVGVMFAFGIVPAVFNLAGAAILAKWGRD